MPGRRLMHKVLGILNNDTLGVYTGHLVVAFFLNIVFHGLNV